MFVPDALLSGNNQVIREYLHRLKNKKINSYINLNIPVHSENKKEVSKIKEKKYLV